MLAREFGVPRAFVGVFTETIFSMLVAPMLMCTQTVAVMQILGGFDSGWKAQRRDGGGIPFADAMRFHWRHMVVGVVLVLLCWYSSPGFLAWMAPVILGLLLAAPLSWLTSRNAGRLMSKILSTPEDRNCPAILRRTDRCAEEWTVRIAELSRRGSHQRHRRSAGAAAPFTDLPRAA